MTYEITVRLSVTDAHALVEYAKTCATDYGMRPEDIDDMTVPEALRWLYDPGTSWPGSNIDDCIIEYLKPMPVATGANAHAREGSVIPTLIPW